ncbi:MAG: hypothetical protein DRP84_09650 [Spirochaetes bacterium]|nr:MAG: hypothetical protein DRP84_09650 [Spirochaetota bacterium]RLJ07831.1 MAG: hypothetical protein DRP16_02685 [Candidatus Aenigmarchaeota archaeon]
MKLLKKWLREMRRSFKVLITGVGSTTALSVIKGLKKQDVFNVFIVGTDINEEKNIAGSKFCDKFFKVPLAINEENYIATLADIINSESIDLLIPIVDIELEVIARNRDVIEKSTYLLLSSYDTVMICNDKFRTYDFFNKQGIPTLKTILADDFSKIKNLLVHSGMDFPLIAKPRKGVSSRDIYEIQNEEELFLIKKVKDPLLQEKGRGQEYTIDVFCDGENSISAVPRKRIETRAGISYKGQTEKDEKLISPAKKIAERLNIKGPANIQCFKNGDEVRFFEINPRFSGSLPLTIAAGVNTPLFALKMAAGEKLEPVKDFKIVKMCRYWKEVFYDGD